MKTIYIFISFKVLIEKIVILNGNSKKIKRKSKNYKEKIKIKLSDESELSSQLFAFMRSLNA